MTLFSGVIAFNTSLSGLKAAHSSHKDNLIHGKICHSELLVFVFLDRAKSLHALGPGGGGGAGGWGGDYSTMFYTGRLRPEVQPFNLLYTIFDRKGSLSYTFY